MSRKKVMPHNTVTCKNTGIFETLYDVNNVPYLQCSNCGKVIDDWIRWNESYINYWRDPNKWDSKKDHLMCLLSYFNELYRQAYQVDFTFSLNDKGLFNGKEVYCIRKMYSMLSNDAGLAKEYLDWFFTQKVKLRNKQITSLSILAVPELIQEFKLRRQRAKRIARSTPLPVKMIEWIQINTPAILDHISLRDFGELKMALTYYRDGLLNHVPEFVTFVDRLKFNRIIDSDCNIINWSE